MSFHHRHGANDLRVLATILLACAWSVGSPSAAKAAETTEADSAAVDTAADAEAAAPGVEEVTVTARHRTENLQDVPIAVTARQLEASGNFSIRQRCGRRAWRWTCAPPRSRGYG